MVSECLKPMKTMFWSLALLMESTRSFLKFKYQTTNETAKEIQIQAIEHVILSSLLIKMSKFIDKLSKNCHFNQKLWPQFCMPSNAGFHVECLN